MDTVEPDVKKNRKTVFEVEKNMTLHLQKLFQIHIETDAMTQIMVDSIEMLDGKPDGEKTDSNFPFGFEQLLEKNKEYRLIAERFIKETAEDIDSWFDEIPFGPFEVYNVAILFLKSLQNFNLNCVPIYGKIDKWLNDMYTSQIAALATAVYLENWLAVDNNSYQTPYGFALHPYNKEAGSKKGQYDALSEGEKSKIERVFKRQELFFELRQWQNKKEGTFYKDKQYEEGLRGRLVDLITLAWCEAYSVGALSLLDYLFERKNIMNRAEDIRSKKATGLEIACLNYQNYIHEINSIDTSEKAPIEGIRRYVASSMLFHRIERAYRFHMQGRIAQRICNGDIDPIKYNIDAGSAFYDRFEATNMQLFVPSWSASKSFDVLVREWQLGGRWNKRTNKPKIFINEPLEILNEDCHINFMYSVDGEEIAGAEAFHHLQRRIVLTDTITLLMTLFPPEKQPAWTELNFREAAAFYRNYYPVTAQLHCPVFPESKKRQKDLDATKFYTCFRSQYEERNLDEKGPLASGRHQYEKLLKKSVKKKK